MGVTRLKKAGEATNTSTSKGPGTIPYMAPEMFRKARRGPPVDVYSLGCLYIELFGRRRVWPELDDTEIISKERTWNCVEAAAKLTQPTGLLRRTC